MKEPAALDDNEDSEEEDLNGNDKSSQSSDQEEGNKIYKASKLNPVFYEDKNTKKQRRDEQFSKKKMAKSEYVETLRKELYDEPEEVHLGGLMNKKSAFAK